ncbi:MAG TPA: beta galactosidase jelly roll domain-containing protein, partial [Candidatus Sulfotelmatobacter sp.]|nr:beta galactosidase jelly roll domain-containing protein [Candidatus Sulfotelmatobacter sp.]
MLPKLTRQAVLATVLLFAAVLAAPAAPAPRQRQGFDFDWRFHLGDLTNAATPQLADSAWRQLDLPHDFSREGEFASNNVSSTAFLPGGIAWYRKAFLLPADWQDKLVSIEFDGVSMNSEVWINGHYLGKRPYAYSSFAYDLTPHLRRGQTNLLAVRADRSAIDDSRYYTGSGIYRHVWLIATEKVHVARHGVYITTPQVEPNRARVAIQTRVQNQAGAPAEVELITDLLNPEGQAVGSLTNQARIAAGGETLLTQKLEVAAPRLWSPETPALYTTHTTVR